MGRRPVPLPPSLNERPFTVAGAREHGVRRGRMRGADLVVPFRGIRAPADCEDSTRARCLAYAVGMDEDEFFSHATAAELFHLPLPARLQRNDVHVACALPRRSARANGVVGHALNQDLVRVVEWDGVRVAHPIDAWCQLAADLSVRELVVAGDALVRRKKPLTTMERLEETVTRLRGRRGSRRLRVALALVRPGTDSPTETELRLDVIDAGMPEPAVNVPIYDEHGRLVAIGDMVFVENRVVVEYDGEQHRLDDRQYARDVDRLDDLAHLGYRVIRVNKHHRGARRKVVLQRIRAALTERGWKA